MFGQTAALMSVSLLFRSYYESSDLPAALSVIEEALARHPNLVSDDFTNMAAELYIANRQHNKALEVEQRHAERERIKGSAS